ncbi:hypothetical protein EYC84_009178 [Monilinia fructicola]|uniref:Uncharacterized protein n=1 Tax=Monilinia fructicola TaxID=38448 RepID=A0A5M9JD16_MONFR|nr:hypothetical protein EYC84_009178 [Monilinia fructicola]
MQSLTRTRTLLRQRLPHAGARTATRPFTSTRTAPKSAVASKIVDGIEVGQTATQKAKAAAGLSGKEAKGKAAEAAGDVKGKAQEFKGEAKGKAQELKGEAKGKAQEVKGKL